MIPQLEIDLALECLGLVEKKTGYGRDPVCFKILIGEVVFPLIKLLVGGEEWHHLSE